MDHSEIATSSYEDKRRETAGTVSNTVAGGSADVVIQVGAIHGDVTINREMTAAPVALRQLPPLIQGFAGRSEELSILAGMLAAVDQPMPVVVCAVAGLAGVGKTALAVHAAHAVVDAGMFPGGVLFVDLHGYDDNPTPADQILDSLLRALGVPGRHIPPGLDARAGLYRSLLARSDSPVLVIADNASAAEQVTPLLPGDRRHRVLATSRHTLRLNGRVYDLDVLTPSGAVGLLDAALRTADPSDTRIAASAGQAAHVAELCGRLPLALQIAAALLISDPGKTVAELGDELSEESHRLVSLDDGERAVRSAFELSYRRLPAEQARLFRLLALNPGPDLALAAAAVLAEEPPQRVKRMLGELLRAHMVQRAPVSDRWTMHDLLWDYARSLVAHEPENERQHRLRRLLNYYLHAAAAANQGLGPGRVAPTSDEALSEDSAAGLVPVFTGRREATAWLEAERANLQSCVCVASAASASDAIVAIGIAHAMADFMRFAGYCRQAVAVHRAAAASADAAGDLTGRATALTDLGASLRATGDLAAAVDILAEAVQRFEDLQDHTGQALALMELGAAQRLLGRYPSAIGTLRRALALHGTFDDPLGRAAVLGNMGAAQRLMGDLPAALTSLTEALHIHGDLRDDPGQARVLITIGAVQRETGDYPAAAESLTNSMRLHQELNDRSGEAEALSNLGAVQWLTGDLQTAVGTLSRALRLQQDLDNELGQANALTFLGAVQRQMREFTLAEESLSRALAIYRQRGDRGGEVEALNHYAQLHTVTGNPVLGRELHLRALDLAREIRSHWDEANTLCGLAATHLADGDVPNAEAYFAQAMELYKPMGCTADIARLQTELNHLRSSSTTEDG